MAKLALSMIVRDAAAILPACLQSVRGVVDEMLIADTGSVDNTVQVAKNLGARVFSIPWANNFAEARNRALAEVTADWVLSLDADEHLDACAANQIRPLLRQQAVSGFLVTIRNYVLSLEERIWDRPAKPNDSLLPAANAFPAFVEHVNVRLFRRDDEIYFVGRVHESVGPRIEELRRKLAPAPFCIHHFGLTADPETRARKNNFYRDLGRDKLREMPENAQAHLELGIVELDSFHNLEQALALFARACELSPRLGVAWFFRGLTLAKLERFPAALQCLALAEKCGHRTALVAETHGDVSYNMKCYSQACKSYELALRRQPASALLESKLGLARVLAGKVPDGLGAMQRAMANNPAVPELHDRLILAFVSLDRLQEAACVAEQKLALVPRLEPRDFLRAASLWAKTGNQDRSAKILQAGLRLFPAHEKLLQGLREVLPAPDTPHFATCSNPGTSGG